MYTEHTRIHAHETQPLSTGQRGEPARPEKTGGLGIYIYMHRSFIYKEHTRTHAHGTDGVDRIIIAVAPAGVSQVFEECCVMCIEMRLTRVCVHLCNGLTLNASYIATPPRLDVAIDIA